MQDVPDQNWCPHLTEYSHETVRSPLGLVALAYLSLGVPSAHQFRVCGNVALSGLDGGAPLGLPVFRDEEAIQEGERLSTCSFLLHFLSAPLTVPVATNTRKQ